VCVCVFVSKSQKVLSPTMAPGEVDLWRAFSPPSIKNDQHLESLSVVRDLQPQPHFCHQLSELFQGHCGIMSHYTIGQDSLSLLYTACGISLTLSDATRAAVELPPLTPLNPCVRRDKDSAVLQFSTCNNKVRWLSGYGIRVVIRRLPVRFSAE